MKIHRLTITEFSHVSKMQTFWHAICDCGNKTIVRGGKFKFGGVKSCGCAQKDAVGSINRTHGKANKEPEYITWKRMRDRCNNKNNPAYKNYGGRGIKICARWNNYENFIFDMGKKPKNFSIERVDNNKGYFPENCVWADRKTQSRNKRTNIFVTINNERLTVSDAAKKYGIHAQTIYSRISKGMSPEDAFKKSALFTAVKT